ncbi:efflux RND transporter periplasmic adaptor subunit [Gammaproteobacteria bacterium]|nr:efflux RND transporter periplasmic adaptor subunit [Gammaproteobacteria bacterium]MDC1112721.1 efflux RND transporter periplasmic adaptor subunit [bacterium]MDC3228488.1 efflux RND transporter periplasmic adaptor subunit [Gammaproteobacteria bacterium]
MNKFLHFSFFFLLAVDLSSNTSLEITTIEIQDSYNTIQRFPGKILPLNYSKLAFEVPGKIADVKIDIGDAVKKNEILAALDPAEMQANLNQAQARFDLAEQALKRFKDLKSKGFISNQELDRANSEFLIAKAQVDLYSVKLEQTFIRAPFDGYIQNRFLDSGTVISPGAPILEIIDSTFVEAHVSVPSNVIEGLKEGEFYNFLIDGKIFSAKLKRFTKMSNQGSDNRLCIFEFSTFISPGSISYLQLNQQKSATGAWVPLKSLSQGTQGLWNLYTVSKDNNDQFKVAKEIVELIYVEGNNAYISGTISTGDMVVAGGAEKVIENEILKAN